VSTCISWRFERSQCLHLQGQAAQEELLQILSFRAALVILPFKSTVSLAIDVPQATLHPVYYSKSTGVYFPYRQADGTLTVHLYLVP
jgi:hypothetical protein